MKQEQQRIVIAEACGWRVIDESGFRFLASPDGRRGTTCGQHLSYEEVFEVHFNRTPEVWLVVPDYLNDLNAMHEAEKTLGPGRWTEYWHHLFDIERRYQASISVPIVLSVIHATAPQRAEAFLRTLNIWKD